MASSSLTEPKVRDLLETVIHNFIVTKRRFPFIESIANEVDSLLEHLREHGSPSARIRNDGVLQLARDSFDMFVIDLASIRESMIERVGVLNRLKAEPQLLKRWAPADIRAPEGSVAGAEPQDDQILHGVDAHFQNVVAGNINKALERLVGNEYPVTSIEVKKLIARFMKETEAVKKDRNHVRAHRYEHRSFDRRRHFQPISELKKQIEVFDSYIRDLYLVLTGADYHLELQFAFDPKTAAQDLADIMVHGRINDAVNTYFRLPRSVKDGKRPWYWSHREEFLK